MSLLLGIDLGTSYFKVGLFSPAGVLRGLGRVPVDARSPAPGRVELPPVQFWSLLRAALAEALNQAGSSPGEIIGVAYSSQASTFLLLDEADEPITPLVIWSDTRGESVAEEYQAFCTSESYRRQIGYTGVSGRNAACKWVWFQRHQPAVWARTRRIMTVADYLTFGLTGERVGDAGTAAFLGVYDLERKGWWPEALEMFGIRAESLSVPLKPGTPCGTTIANAAAVLGLPAGIPFAVGSINHHVGALGGGIDSAADVSISTGTVLAALAIVDEITPQPGRYFGLHTDGKRFFCLAFNRDGAAQLEDYQRQYAPYLSIEQLLALAAISHGRTHDGSIGSDTAKILESIGGAQRELVRKVAGSRPIRKVVATGGGARSPLWLQIQADVLNLPVFTSDIAEKGCLGAAAFAAVAAGIVPTIENALAAMIRVGPSYEPSPPSNLLFSSGNE